MKLTLSKEEATVLNNIIQKQCPTINLMKDYRSKNMIVKHIDGQVNIVAASSVMIPFMNGLTGVAGSVNVLNIGKSLNKLKSSFELLGRELTKPEK